MNEPLSKGKCETELEDAVVGGFGTLVGRQVDGETETFEKIAQAFSCPLAILRLL